MPILINNLIIASIGGKSGVATTSSGLLAENSDFLITESGNFLSLE